MTSIRIHINRALKSDFLMKQTSIKKYCVIVKRSARLAEKNAELLSDEDEKMPEMEKITENAKDSEPGKNRETEVSSLVNLIDSFSDTE